MKTNSEKIVKINPNNMEIVELDDEVYEKLCCRAKEEEISPSLLALRLLQLNR